MGYFFDTFGFEAGSRLTGVFTAGANLDTTHELVATASLVQLGRLQHDVVESDFLGAHLPFHVGGFHGMGPDGWPWTVMLQLAPVSAATLVDADPFWPMDDGLSRALALNAEATLIEHLALDRDAVFDIYLDGGVDASSIDEWDLPELMLGLLAECCYVPLQQIVVGRITQCAFPHADHDCQHDVFGDVFAMWASGQLSPEG